MLSVIFFQYPFMNIKNNITQATLFGSLIRILRGKLTQNPEFYNIKHYTKRRSRKRNQGGW